MLSLPNDEKHVFSEEEEEKGKKFLHIDIVYGRQLD